MGHEMGSDDYSTLDWINLKRDCFFKDDETPEDFASRIQTLVFSSHNDNPHDEKKETTKTHCENCVKMIGVESLGIFINGFVPKIRISLEAQLAQNLETQTLDEAVKIVQDIIQK